MKCFALTGGIASGKSTVSALLKAAHIPVIDADVLARRVVEPGTNGLDMIIKTFGHDLLHEGGSLNRHKMAKLIFSNTEARKKLEDIVHPLIADELRRELQEYDKQGVAYVVYEAPLIFEKSLQRFFDATILVSAADEIQIDRLINRDKITREDALARIRAQMSAAEKEKLANHVILNQGTHEDTAAQLKRVWSELTGQYLEFSS